MTIGLEGVIAAETTLCEVDGERGALLLRGRPLAELAGLGYAGMAAHLWQDLDPAADAATLRADFAGARSEAFPRACEVAPLAAALPAVDGLRLGLSALGPHPSLRPHVWLCGALPVLLAAQERVRAGARPIAPDPALGQAADFLRMLRGTAPSAEAARGLETYLVTVAEHGMCASTFAARVIASTRSDPISACVGALCALKGPLHGGAPGPVLDMLDAVGSPPHAVAWVAAELAAGRRLMGFGHRVYKVRDPRADVLRGAFTALAGDGPRLALALAVERAALEALAAHKPGRELFTNVEFFTALLLEAVGLGRELFTPVFAFGRLLGWNAHILEQAASGRLIRPRARYIGPRPAAASAPGR